MPTKFWINRIHSADKRADLSNPISTPKDYTLNSNGQVEIDLRRTPSDKKTKIKPGDIIYIAVNGYFDKKGNNSLRIVAKGEVYDIDYSPKTGKRVPFAIFKQDTFKHLTAPMINGLDIKSESYQSPYWSISDDKVNYFDENVFNGSGVKSI